jgi:uncharacterized damage-inducible protein DinB
VDLTDHLRRQFAYNAWANWEVLTTIRSGDKNSRLLALMSHIVSAESLWLERLKGEPQRLPVWPEFDLDECQQKAKALEGLWIEYLKPASTAWLSETISYKNSKGESWSSTVQDVLTHVVMHSAYHRGQIASLMRTNGQVPAYTDFIHAVRQGFIE